MDTTKSLTSLNEAVWWRFEDYEIQGEMVVPAPGAKLIEYSPWDCYISPKGRRVKPGMAPHEQLINLFRECIPEGDRGRRPFREMRPDTEGRVLDWCRQYGLLGTLLNYTQSVKLHPLFGFVAQTQREDVIGGVQQQYVKATRGWARTDRQLSRRDAPAVPVDASLDGTPYPSDQLTVDGQGGAIHTGDYFPALWEVGFSARHSGDPTSKPLDYAWAHYFPAVPPADKLTYQYSMPLSSDFWHLYAEPVQEILSHAEMLHAEFSYLSSSERWLGEIKQYGCLLGGHVTSKILEETLPSLAYYTDGSIQLRWHSRTLLATLAMMIVTDVSESLQYVSCQNPSCSRSFTTPPRSRQIYCSDRCRETAAKSRVRMRQRAAQQMHAQGIPPHKIAQKLGVKDLSQIRGWIEDS